MDLTSSPSFVTDPTTGNRMHLASQVVPTVVSDSDLNGLNWEVVSAIKAAGLVPVAFDKGNPASYTQLAAAIKSLGSSTFAETRITADQTILASVEGVLNAVPTVVDCDLFTWIATGDFVVKKKGSYLVAMRLTVSVAAVYAYWMDHVSVIKAYKAAVAPTLINSFKAVVQYQPLSIYSGPTPVVHTLESRMLVSMDIGDKVRFASWLSGYAHTVSMDNATKQSMFEFIYLGT